MQRLKVAAECATMGEVNMHFCYRSRPATGAAQLTTGEDLEWEKMTFCRFAAWFRLTAAKEDEPGAKKKKKKAKSESDQVRTPNSAGSAVLQKKMAIVYFPPHDAGEERRRLLLLTVLSFTPETCPQRSVHW